MIYSIGGPARCGKSTLAARFRRHIDAQVLSGDALTHALQDNFLKPQWLPDLFEHDVDPLNSQPSDQKRVERLRRRDMVMWQFYKGYFEHSAHTSNDNIIIDGNIWPDSLATLSLNHRAVFVVDTSLDSQAKRLMAIRDSNQPNNWMKHHNYTNEKIEQWAAFNAERSCAYVTLCQTHQYVYFDIATLGIAGASAQAFEYLHNDTV